MTASKVVIVTGAARGIGRAVALGMAESGARVIAVCRPRPAGAPAMEPFPGPSAERIHRVDADITSEHDCAKVVAAALERFGSADVLVNNAALSHEQFPKFHDTTFADVDPDLWRAVIDVNVNGTFLMTRAAVPGMVARGWGRVINIQTSPASMLAKGVLPYGPSKAAIEAMTVGWSEELAGAGVTVNALLPGGPTGPHVSGKHWWPEGSRSWPAEMMVPPIRWLASPASDGVTARRFTARLWDASLPGAEAAARAGVPAGWPLAKTDFSARPER